MTLNCTYPFTMKEKSLGKRYYLRFNLLQSTVVQYLTLPCEVSDADMDKMFCNDQEKVQSIRTHSVRTLPRFQQRLSLPMVSSYRQHNVLSVVWQRSPDADKTPPLLSDQHSLNSALHIQKLQLTAEKRIHLNQPLLKVKELPTWSLKNLINV